MPGGGAQGIGFLPSYAAMTPHSGLAGLSFANLLRFWAVAASRNSSRAPRGPLSLKRAIWRIRLR